MGWPFKDKGPGWKKGWTEQAITSISAPPLPLLSIFGIICVLLMVSSYINLKREVHHTVFNLKLFLLFLPVMLIFAAQFLSKCERLVVPYVRTKRDLFGCDVWLVLGRLSSQTCFRKPFHIFQAFPPKAGQAFPPKAGQGEDL
ncbi:hypothetical protein ES332_A06G004700v1 [Gossypium tomentosum]|uniref:Uncharacterized protein n=1 Tax=Gossypium tomentosum TaxID=34277 RepID=A0A5D2PYC6_GOSTO|nr:hypothetical protein ES332_A06G004700v1 [Gossypium tomentosum]